MMKITINLSKSRLYVVGLLVMVLLASLIVFGTGFSSGQPSHPTLFTDTIRGRSGAQVNINDNLNINAGFVQYTSGATDASRFAIVNTPTGRRWDVGVFGPSSPSPGGFAIGDINAGAWRMYITLVGRCSIKLRRSMQAISISAETLEPASCIQTQSVAALMCGSRRISCRSRKRLM